MTKHREDLHFNEENINTHHSTFTILGACNTDNSTDHKMIKQKLLLKDKNNKASNKDESMTKNKDDKHTQTTLEKNRCERFKR